LVIEGRRYRLVPVADADPLSARPAPGPSVSELLTSRELQIASLVAEGLINKQIAEQLRISEWTVSTHLRRIFAKLGVDTRAAMVCRCMGGVGLKG
jgi:DNA-binding NarL/FixJ family response regulator